MLAKQKLVEYMVKNPERVGYDFFWIGDRVVFTIHKEHVEWPANRNLRWPVKRQIRHVSFLMPAEVPAVLEPSLEGWRFENVAEEIAEKKITHTLRGNWQQKVAKSFGLDPKDIVYKGYKVVAIKDNRYLSLYDGKTEYKLGELLEQTARRDHQGGYYVLESICLADSLRIPTNAVLWNWPNRAILMVKYGGKIVRYKNKVAASWIRPLYMIKTFYV